MREARARVNLPQDKLGVAIGLDESCASARMSRYEAGVHEPTFTTSKLIAQALDVLPPYFYCEDEGLAEVILAWKRLSDVDKRTAKDFVTALADT